MTRRKPFIDVLSGMAVIVLCHVVYIAIVFLLPSLLYQLNLLSLSDQPYFFITVWIVGFVGMGLLQLLYVIPFYFYFRRRERFDMAKGVAIMAGITLLLNGGCYLIAF